MVNFETITNNVGEFELLLFSCDYSLNMGCDGGTIPRRDELVRTAKRPEQVNSEDGQNGMELGFLVNMLITLVLRKCLQKDKEAEMAFRWRHCAMTQAKLQEPIVMCGLGRLYSKQSVIENLLDKEKMPETAKHIKSLKDIKDLKLTSNPAYNKDADKFEGAVDVRNAPYICKLIGLEMAGKFRFVALWSCGCVFSERAFKELKSSACSVVSPILNSIYSSFTNIPAIPSPVPETLHRRRRDHPERQRGGCGTNAA